MYIPYARLPETGVVGMHLKWTATVFPLAVLGLMTAERLATFLLGIHPSEAALWAVSLELRSIFRYPAGWMETATGGSIALQVAMPALLAMLLLTAMRTRYWTTLSFLVNHVVLIFVVTTAMAAGGNTIASSGGSFLESGRLLVSASLRFETFHYAVMAIGFLGCASCHYLFLAQKSARDRTVAVALKALAFSLEGKRPAR